MMRSAAVFSLLLCSTAFAALDAPAKGVLGDWKTPLGSVVRIEPCGGAVCLKIVKLPANAPETTDKLNPSAGLRQRPLCALKIGTGFHEDDPAHLSGGHLYDPISGHTYRGTITSTGSALRLRGYIGIPLFGRSQTWHRVDTITPCS
jgi:uncharacterized protein (DUF2147 family)